MCRNSQRSLTGKRDDACVKEKRHLLDKGNKLFFLFQAVTNVLITSLLSGVWAPRIRLWT